MTNPRIQRNESLAREITLLAGHINAANYRLLCLIAEFDRNEGWGGVGIRSCAHWLQWQCGISLGPAREKVRVARRLEQLPKIAAAFSLGELSYSMVRAITRQADPDTEDYYLHIARYGTVSHIEKLVRKHNYVEKLQMAGMEAAQYDSRDVDCFQGDDGMWLIRAKLPPAEGELLVKALDAIQNCCDPIVVPRSLTGEHGGPVVEDRTEIKTFGQKRADALHSLAEHYLATAQEGPEALKGAERNQVMLHVDLITLQENSGENHCRLDHDNWLHPDSARRLSCDASLVTVLENDKGEVLNIGRRTRIIPPHIHRALQTRDHGHCQYPGCENSRYTDAHHVKHWADGGETCLDNLVIQCRYHHRAHHQGEFTITPGDIAGEFRFHDVFGREILPAAWPQFPEQEGPEAEVLVIENHSKNVSAETCKTAWCGERMDYGMAIDALLSMQGKGLLPAHMVD